MISFGIRDEDLNYPVREAAYGLLVKHGTIAIVETPRGCFLPGGGIEGDESHEACIIRELQEELGMCVKVISYVMTTRLTDVTPSRDYPIDMVAHCYLVKDTGGRTLAIEEDHELVWMDFEEASHQLRLPHQSWVTRHLDAVNVQKTIIPYKRHWAWWFITIKNQLMYTLDKEEVTIEHVGSTSIPGMSAKAVIDIDIVLSYKALFEDISQSLISIGYAYVGNQGIEGREVFKRGPMASNEALDRIPHHLYVCYEHSEELKRHLAFRDKLQKEDVLRDEYKALKEAIISQVGPYDRAGYVELKATSCDEFFRKVLES